MREPQFRLVSRDEREPAQRSGSAARRGYVSQEAFVLASFLFGQQRRHPPSTRDQVEKSS